MEDIDVKELKERLEKKDKFLFLDVREEWEYEDDNLGAKNIPLADLPHRLEELDSYKDQEIIIHCRSGARSGNAKKFLESKGFSQVRNVLGGIMAYRDL
ncbi:Rhodanese-related sulfurtransferase [Algoriphagus ornithinivorans]|jgi:rhodanese-related sulfurtransferase|uniref:Rhodanese-related sulfurtransferase n=1 Tax=Algoriphagus ornithinivorans TaxID=226506 RepID=A0A1I5JQ21_9BACT|nr:MULTISPECIES: rhodanese-like domain-containing protein [Algoriphagus]MAL13389.1 rhodanese-like domain-containing protein [Algoriphagus sp.]MAN85544.1 rhodanese-like domain-containing protein [Algoriphagus sp.]QYH39018.1 rhodanese-like domain-containing protein [Algoriphagus sp. NBT04N3]SFO74924.1 Rhodanese-related sulfurtransferase [Algoriphagus ornithinivorans]HAD52276.1 rhodanese-like domain-containing protein [Algoriphagus sp.]|tara:strand:- start:2090 stop:2386 length:297 start_codon:yes stop_codon:yes gene_type:complete